MSAVVRAAGAALAVGSAVLHGFSVGHGVVGSVLMLAMAVACLYCAAELVTRDTDRAWVLVAVMNLGMIALHLPMAGHVHGAIPSTASGVPTGIAVATVLAVLEALLATAVLAYRSRGYSPGAAERT